MSILNEMINFREELVRNDRLHAMKIMTRKIYYKVTSYAEPGERFKLFDCKNAVNEFCDNNQVDIRAMEWLLDSMRKEDLIGNKEMPIILTPHAIEKLC